MVFPDFVVHADWSLHKQKRWLARAVLQPNGRYLAHAPQRTPPPAQWLALLQAETGVVLVGVDFPIGLPEAYAQQVGVRDFLAILPRLGHGEWRDFYRVARKPAEIELKRPFYPQRPGGAKQQHLLDGLQLSHVRELRRRCEQPQAHRRAAAPLFWTLGAQQVGKAAISGWQELLVPARQSAHAAIWPFSGRLADLLADERLIVAEAYPAEFYTQLGLSFPPKTGKRSQNGRLANADRLWQWADQNRVSLTPALRAAIQEGFGPDAAGEDPFDAVVGLFGMLNVVLGKRPLPEPEDPAIRQIEGWILGQAL